MKSYNQKVRFYNPAPENAAPPGLKKAILELSNQEMTLQEGLKKLREANKTSFPIGLDVVDKTIFIAVKIPFRGTQTIMKMTLISFEEIP